MVTANVAATALLARERSGDRGLCDVEQPLSSTHRDQFHVHHRTGVVDAGLGGAQFGNRCCCCGQARSFPFSAHVSAHGQGEAFEQCTCTRATIARSRENAVVHVVSLGEGDRNRARAREASGGCVSGGGCATGRATVQCTEHVVTTVGRRAVQTRTGRIASGEEAWLDYDRIMPIIRNVGFNGWMSIVFEGQDELDEPTAVPLANSFMRSMLAKYEM